MNWSDYSVDGQISMFDLIENETNSFNPLEELALHGTGFVDGMKRVTEYFSQNHTMAEKASFLKKEYGLGGFGSPVKSLATYIQWTRLVTRKKMWFSVIMMNI